MFFFLNDTATTEIYTLSLHDALPISAGPPRAALRPLPDDVARPRAGGIPRAARIRLDGTVIRWAAARLGSGHEDRKSTRLNSSHANISYAVFCLKKKKN